MADLPDFRQMMDALDEAFADSMETAFNNLYMSYNDKGAAKVFFDSLAALCSDYETAASEIEKKAGAGSTEVGSADFRQMMDALDGAFTETMKTAFRPKPPKPSNIAAALPILREAYKTAAFEIEKKTNQVTGESPAKSQAKKNLKTSRTENI